MGGEGEIRGSAGKSLRMFLWEIYEGVDGTELVFMVAAGIIRTMKHPNSIGHYLELKGAVFGNCDQNALSSAKQDTDGTFSATAVQHQACSILLIHFSYRCLFIAFLLYARHNPKL